MNSDLKVPLLTVLFLFISLYIFSTIFGPIPFSVNSVTTTKTDFFTSSGTGEESGIPDTAQISLGVTKEAATVQQAQNEVNEISNNISSDLKKAGVKETDIKTTNYSVTPNYDFTSGRQQANGYTVSQTMEVKVKPIEKANEVIDIATKNGANLVGSVTFVLADEEQKKLENKARKEAIDNAKEKAEETARLAGIKLGKIINITESSEGRPMPMYAAADMKMEGAPQSAPTQLNPGQNTVSIGVTLYYQTL